MKELFAVMVLSIIVEAIIEYLGKPLPSTIKPYIAAALAVVVCVAYQADVLALVGLPAAPYRIGAILTGLVIGRGSNYLADILRRIQTVPAPAMPVSEVKE